MRALTPVLTAVAVATLLSSCATESPATSGGGDRPPASESPGETSSDPEPDLPQETGLQTGDNTAPWDLVVTDVRVGEHDGYDRLVLEFSGKGRPGWAARYVDEAVQEGSGEVLPIEGDAIVQVDVSGTTFEGAGAARPPQVEPLGILSDVHVGGAFEGYSQVFIGLDGGRTPFEVSALTGPTRLVIDVATD